MRVAFALAIVALGCGKSADPAAGSGGSQAAPGSGSQVAAGSQVTPGSGSQVAASAAPSPARDSLVTAWKQAGLTPSALAPLTTDVGKDCATGSVNEVDLLVCVYASTGEAKEAEYKGLVWVGEVTGAAQAHGTVLVAIADRHKKDPNGRTINQVMKLAKK